jgi:flavorubredoxin
MIINAQSGTNIQEIADSIYRINTPVQLPDASQFNFNQYLIVDDAPMLFHTGQRQLFPVVREAIEAVIPVARLRYIGLSHFEADECGSLNALLAAAPEAVPVCSRVAAMVAINDYADRAPRALADGEDLQLGRHAMRWFDTPHMPHSWECGLMMDMSTRTFFCGDLFTQGGSGEVALTESDILGPSESFRSPMDYFAHSPQTSAILERLAQQQPTTLACMHGSAWRGDGEKLLLQLSVALTKPSTGGVYRPFGRSSVVLAHEVRGVQQ